MISRVRPPFVLATSQVVIEGSAFLRNLILARLLGAEQMGLAVALALGIRCLEMIGDLGLERLLVQVRSSGLPGIRGTVHLVQAVKGFALVAIAALLAAPLCEAINPALDPAVFILASAALAIRGLINCDYRERQRNSDFSGLLYAEGISNVAALVFVAPIAMATRDYSALAWASVLQASLLCLFSHLIAKSPIKFVVDRDSLAAAFRFGIPIAGNGILIFMAMQGDRLIVATNFAPEDLAKFAISAQLTLLPALVGARFLLTLDLPRFSKLDARPSALLAQHALRLKQVALVAALMFAAFSFFGSGTVEALYGTAYTPEPELMMFLAAAASLRLVRAVPNTLLLSKGKTMMMLVCNVPRLIALPVAIAFVASGYGLVAVVAIGTVSEALGLAIGLGAVASSDRRAARPERPLLEVSR